MNVSRFFIDRPIFAGVLSVLVFLAGLISIFNLPVSEYPDVVPPSVVVRATYPGANPKVIAETVAAPLEEQINGVEHMLYMESQATTDGVLQLTVTFKIGTDIDQAETQVQNRVQRALPRLPEEVRQIGVITQKSSPDFAMVVHILSPTNATTSSICATTPSSTSRTTCSASPAWDRCRCSAPGTMRCACGSTRRSSRAAT